MKIKIYYGERTFYLKMLTLVCSGLFTGHIAYADSVYAPVIQEWDKRFNQYSDISRIETDQLSDFNYNYDHQKIIYGENGHKTDLSAKNNLTINDAVLYALQQHPQIAQVVAELASQHSYIDVAKASYYPQLSGGLSTGDFTTGERGRQLISLNATQMLYDFGKTSANVDIQQTKTYLKQTEMLSQIDTLAKTVTSSILMIKRYQELELIARNQIQGIQRIYNIAQLRANAGISSQSDPIQVKSYLEAAQSSLISQQTQLKLYQQRLNTVLGFDVSRIQWIIPDNLVKSVSLYDPVEYNTIPSMMSAQLEIDIARLQYEQTRLESYPVVNLKGSLSQAINGRNPNNNKDDGLYSSVMMEATSNFFQGGAIKAQQRASLAAEQAAISRLNTAYLNVLEQVRMNKEQIEHKNQQLAVLFNRAKTTAKTKELYEEQYKLGTRTVVDLLNAEQSVHSVAQEIENARYDIFESIVQYIAVTGQSRQLYQLNNKTIQGIEIKP